LPRGRRDECSAEGGILVLLSGGIDSAVALWMARGSEPRSPIHSLTINYYKRSAGEVACAEKLARIAGVATHTTVELGFLRELEDMDNTSTQPYPENFMPPVFIPCRNLVFYSCAAHVAFNLRASRVIVGHNRDDVVRFPDVAASFIELFNELIRRSLPRYRLRIEAPLLGLSKRDVIVKGLELGVPLQETWSCWRAATIQCGRCEGCLTRRRLFKELNIEDETVYEH